MGTSFIGDFVPASGIKASRASFEITLKVFDLCVPFLIISIKYVAISYKSRAPLGEMIGKYSGNRLGRINSPLTLQILCTWRGSQGPGEDLRKPSNYSSGLPLLSLEEEGQVFFSCSLIGLVKTFVFVLLCIFTIMIWHYDYVVGMVLFIDKIVNLGWFLSMAASRASTKGAS